MSKQFAVVGNPIEHSRSPELHHAFAQKLGIDLTYNRLTIQDNARARYNMRKFCEAIGAKMGKKIDPSDWIGMSVKVAVTHQKYEGENRAQISAFKSSK